jgi:hypothetical protein
MGRAVEKCVTGFTQHLYLRSLSSGQLRYRFVPFRIARLIRSCATRRLAKQGHPHEPPCPRGG